MTTSLTPVATQLTLGEASRHLGVAKGTISKAIATGKLSATRRDDGSWAIDASELARYEQANGHRFRAATGDADQEETADAVRMRAELAEQRLADLKEALADMRRQRDDMERQRDKWETVAQRLTLPAPKPAEAAPVTPAEPPSRLRSTWRWLRSTG